MSRISLSAVHAAIIFFMFFTLYAIIAITLCSMQIVNYNFYHTRGEHQYAITLTQFPSRAPILDRTGTHFLAMNAESTSAFILPHQIADRVGLEAVLKDHFPSAYRRLQSIGNKKFMYVHRRLSPEQIVSLQEVDCKDIYMLQEPSRYYPLVSASCLVGITDIDNNGLFGLERFYNQQLSGTPTTLSLEKDARSGLFYFAKDTKVSGSPGDCLQLTIDSNMQFLAYQAVHECVSKFGAQEASAIIMEPSTGHILALVNVPCFDPSDTKELDFNSTKVRAITEQYELGSVFKVFAALAALEEGVVMPEEEINCKNSTTAYVDGRRVNTVHAHGILPFRDVVALSNNIGIATVAKRLDYRLYDHYQQLGFGRKTGIELEGESAGFLNPLYNWSKQSCISLSYGYEVSATILQLACAFCLIARDGVPVKPRIILSTSGDEPVYEKPLYSTHSIQTIKDILYRTTQYGTAKRAAIQGYTVLSKTGTANMLENGVYNTRKNRYTCAGIIEKGEYKRVIVVFVQEADRPNLFAATVAAPLFETIAEQMLIAERAI